MKRLFLILIAITFIAASCNDSAVVETNSNINKSRFQEIEPLSESSEDFIIPEYEEDEDESDCDSNYSGCVPVASDVDCASGSGNGPAYVSGPVRVIGSDIYDLDRDGDGWGCE